MSQHTKANLEYTVYTWEHIFSTKEQIYV